METNPEARKPHNRFSSRKPIINRLDHQIYLHGGSTSALEFMDNRLKKSKLESALTQSARIEDLTRELGYMRQEVQFYRICFEGLQRLREETYDIYQQIFIADYLEDSQKITGLTSQLYQALAKSSKQEMKAEQIWMEFWGIVCHGSLEGDAF